jgi:membrane fusion protein (multidrug efflux system)
MIMTLSRPSDGNGSRHLRARPVVSTPASWLARALLAALSLPLFDMTVLAQAPASPPPAVSVVTLSAEDIAQKVEFIGRIEAIQRIDLRARVQGFLEKVEFAEGQDVKADDLLFTIERDQYEAALQQAKAQQKSAEASLQNAQLTLERRQQLYERQAGTRADLDEAIANRDSAAATVDSAKAAVLTAELNLGYTRIKSPIAGRIGRTNFTKGNVVGPDSGPLARVVQLDPIRVVFSVSERDFISVVQQGRGAAIDQINASFVPTLRLPNGTTYADQGRIDFIGNEVDQATGTLPVRASFPNASGLLLPGGTVSVGVRPAEARRMVLVPVQAVQETRQGKFVLVLGADNRVEQRPIKTAQQVGQNWAVEDGLKAGESVIVEGLQKVRPGAQVQALPAPAAEAQ